VWQAQIAALADRADCSVADYGSLDSLAGMAQSVLEHAPAEFAVVGHSMGGRVALEVLRRAGECVRGLALLDTGYQARDSGDAGERERRERMELVDFARRSGMRAMGARWVRGMIHPDRLDDASLMDAILDMIEWKNVTVFEAQQRALLARPEQGRCCPRLAAPL
jgi:pimeloyl-ACP methyl ester carboxylesterase